MQVMEKFQSSSSQFESHFHNLSSSSKEIINNNNMTSFNDTEPPWQWLFPEPQEESLFVFPHRFRLAAHVLYNIVMVLGLIGNGCVLLIFSLRKRPFRKIPTPLLANLAVGDLLITIFCLETGYLSLLWQYWPFGEFLCFALSPVKPIAVFVSCYTLIALSVDRYLGVKNPLKTAVLSRERVSWTIALIWILAICTSVPTGLFTSYEIHFATQLPRCGESLLVVLGYLGLWLPYNIVALLVKYNPTLAESDDFPYIFITCHWFAMSHAVYNPIIYFWLNKSFRTTVLDIFCWKKAMERRRKSSSMFSWRNSTVYTINGRSSISKPPCKMKQLKSPSESSSTHPGSPLLKIPNGVGDIILTTQPDEETSIIISNGDNDGYLSKEKLSESCE